MDRTELSSEATRLLKEFQYLQGQMDEPHSRIRFDYITHEGQRLHWHPPYIENAFQAGHSQSLLCLSPLQEEHCHFSFIFWFEDNRFGHE